MSQLYRFLVSHAEAVLFVAVFAEQIGLPLPAIPILLAAGALIANGVLHPLTALGIAVVASVLADLIWFYLGRRGGGGLLQFFRKVSGCDSADIERTERVFAAHSLSAVAGAKFVPWLGFLVPPLAGIFRIRVGQFLTFDVLGSVLYATVYLALGFLFEGEISRVLEWARHFGVGTALVLSVMAVVYVLHKYTHRRKAAGPVPASSSTPFVPLSRS